MEAVKPKASWAPPRDTGQPCKRMVATPLVTVVTLNNRDLILWRRCRAVPHGRIRRVGRLQCPSAMTLERRTARRQAEMSVDKRLSDCDIEIDEQDKHIVLGLLDEVADDRART